MEERIDARGGARCIRRPHLAHDGAQLVGEDLDLDPLFFEESWTVGKSIALDNLRRRRQWQIERERKSNDSLGFDGVSSQGWTPYDWVPQDRIRQRWIPQGWMPEAFTPIENSMQPQPCIEICDDSMTLSRAQQILDIDSTSTREQTRSAYRRKVTQCHPDHLQDATEVDRQRANQQMTAITEAYRLLCSAMLQAA